MGARPPRPAPTRVDTARPDRVALPPERLFRTLVLRSLYSIRSERLLMEQLEYYLLFPWFVGLGVAFLPFGSPCRG